MTTYNLPLRPRRLRDTQNIRNLLQETRLHPHQLIAPIFVSALIKEKNPISSMPGQFQLPLKDLAREVDEIAGLGIPGVLLFGIPDNKDSLGSDSYKEEGIIQQAIRTIKAANKEILVITDVCFCEYTDHGHCGIIENRQLANDETLTLLAKQALSHVEAGADWVAPSGMIDGMVLALRQALDKAGYTNTAILSYAVKYASSLYAPSEKQP